MLGALERSRDRVLTLPLLLPGGSCPAVSCDAGPHIPACTACASPGWRSSARGSKGGSQ